VFGDSVVNHISVTAVTFTMSSTKNENDLFYNETSTTDVEMFAMKRSGVVSSDDQTTMAVTRLVITTMVVMSSAMVSWWSVVLSVMQWLIFLIGCLGNVLILSVLIWNRSKTQVVTQLFVGSLSLADVALACSLP